MPLLRLPQKIARGDTITRADILDAPSERHIAQGRFVLCLVALLTIYLKPAQSAQYATAITLCLTAYTVFSVALVGLTRHRFLNSATRQLIHFVDVTITSLLLLTEASTSLTLVLSTFVLLTATLRWSWRAVVATATAPALVLLVAAISNGLIATPDLAGSNLNTAIRRSTYLLVIGGMLAYLSAVREISRERFKRLANWPTRICHEEVLSSVHRTLAHAALILEAPRILVVWKEAEEQDIFWGHWRDGDYQHGRESSGMFGNFVDPSLSSAAFMMDHAKSEILLSNGSRRINAPVIDTELVAKFSIGSVATAAFAGTVCTGRIFILDRRGWSDDHLLLTELTACRTGMRLDRLALHRQSEATIAIRERTRLTRDLHDGILQSLTAATLQLSLAEKTSNPARLNMIKQLLTQELHRIREFVNKTRPKAALNGEIALNGDVQQLVQNTARSWNCATSFSVAPRNATVPHALADQLSFVLTEAIANAARHGGASVIDVAMERINGYLDLNIRDNGKGFEVPVRNDHPEPTSIRERICALGGSLNVTSSADGTQLRIRLPTQ